jgi:hypothetical protein
MSRQFIWDVLNTESVTNLVGDRIFPQGSLLTGQIQKPFLVYTVGNNTDEGMADPDSFQPSRQFFQVYIYDEVGDYTRIDSIIKVLKNAFLTSPTSGDVCGIQYLETSRDMDDSTLESIMRYMRFQLAMAR